MNDDGGAPASEGSPRHRPCVPISCPLSGIFLRRQINHLLHSRAALGHDASDFPI